MMQHKESILPQPAKPAAFCCTLNFQSLTLHNPSQKKFGLGYIIHAKLARAVQRNSLDYRRAFSICLIAAWMEDFLRRILRKYVRPIRVAKTGTYYQCCIFAVSCGFSAEISGR